MLKNLHQLEHVIENKVCRFTCDNDTPIVFIKEALFQMQKFIGVAEEQAKIREEAQKKVEPLQEQIQEV